MFYIASVQHLPYTDTQQMDTVLHGCIRLLVVDQLSRKQFPSCSSLVDVLVTRVVGFLVVSSEKYKHGEPVACCKMIKANVKSPHGSQALP